MTRSKIYFCEKNGDPRTSSVRVMARCFDVFIVEEGWLFYRLRDDCEERGYLDVGECLIGPCDGYDQMICMAKIFEGIKPVEYIDSPAWIEEDDFNQNRKNNTIKLLIDEMCKISQMVQTEKEFEVSEKDFGDSENNSVSTEDDLENFENDLENNTNREIYIDRNEEPVEELKESIESEDAEESNDESEESNDESEESNGESEEKSNTGEDQQINFEHGHSSSSDQSEKNI